MQEDAMVSRDFFNLILPRSKMNNLFDVIRSSQCLRTDHTNDGEIIKQKDL